MAFSTPLVDHSNSYPRGFGCRIGHIAFGSSSTYISVYLWQPRAQVHHGGHRDNREANDHPGAEGRALERQIQ